MTKQKRVIVGGLLVFALCGLFPPWLYQVTRFSVRDAGVCFILTGPLPRAGDYSNARMDTSRLLVEWLCVLAVAGAGWLLTARPNERKETKSVEDSLSATEKAVRQGDLPKRRTPLFLVWVVIGIGVSLWAVYVWPTPWRYYKTGTTNLRVKRLTGKTQVLHLNGWTDPNTGERPPTWEETTPVNP